MPDKKFKALTVGVLMGGDSEERMVSLASGKAVAGELKKNGHKVKLIDIKGNGIDKIKNAGIDAAFLALHGKYGEDGIIQGILEFMKIPYTGSGVLASALAMNKAGTKHIMNMAGIPTPEGGIIENINGIRKKGLKYPVVLKPESGGSAVDVFIAKNAEEAAAAVSKIKDSGRLVLAEEYIKGTEITVPVLLDRVLPVIEIVPHNDFYDYDAKYTEGGSTHIIPARIKRKTEKKARELAVKLHAELGCRDYSRIDMIVRKDKCYVLEANTLPGMTGTSLFPEAARAAGISFYELISILIKEAIKRKE
ncbi:MAG: D-alanine--D-alanine ligase [Candidatus Goldiibacteriota bacterium]